MLPRERCSLTSSKAETELTFSQLLHYVAKTNYQNLWKDFYKRYYGTFLFLSDFQLIFLIKKFF